MVVRLLYLATLYRAKTRSAETTPRTASRFARAPEAGQPYQINDAEDEIRRAISLQVQLVWAALL